MRLVNCDVGAQYASPYTEEHTYGNGVLMTNCRDMRWDGRMSAPSAATYSVNTGQPLLKLDADCERCEFTGWQVKIGGGAITDEIEILGDSSNQVEYVAFVNSATPASSGVFTGS